MGERDELPISFGYGSFKDIEILVVPQDAKITGMFSVPAIHHFLDLYGSGAHDKPYRALLALIARTAFDLDLHCHSSLRG